MFSDTSLKERWEKFPKEHDAVSSKKIKALLTYINKKIAEVSNAHKNLLIGYERDFGKYGGKINALHIASIFKSVPLKLQETLDESVKRYTFKKVIEGKKQYRELRGPIDWLEKSKLISKNFSC